MSNIYFNTNKVSIPCKAISMKQAGSLTETEVGKEQSLCFRPSAKNEHIVLHVKNTSGSIVYMRFGKGEYVGASESSKVLLEAQDDYIAFVDTGKCLKNDGSIELIFTPEKTAALANCPLKVKVAEFLPVENH